LRSRAIPFRAVDIEPLSDQPVVRDLGALIRALLHFGDRIAWLAMLRAPWTGVMLADLLLVARGAPVIWEALNDDAVLGRLTDDGRRRCERLRSILASAFRIRTHGTIARWVEQTWLALGGPACVARAEDLDHVGRVFSRLRELEEQGMPDAADLSSSFDDLYAEYAASPAVEIMTIHKAKGLEFDMVIVPALDRHIPGGRDQLLLSHQFSRAGRDGLVLAARPAIGADRDDLFEFLRHQVHDAAALEAQRLLYVACTRAKWRLHLSATLVRRQEADDAVGSGARKAFTPRSGSLLAVLWPVAGTQFTVGEASELPADAPPAAPRGGPLTRVPQDWSPGTEEILAATGFTESAELREETPVFDWAGETARRVGTLVHAELQAMNPARSDEAAIKGRDAHFRRWLALNGVPAERLPEASGRVMSALVAVLGDERARWILKPRTRDDFREHALSGRSQDAVMRVVFDRSFIDDDGVRWVIDYKTSQHGGGSPDEFLDREVERYRSQLHRYAELARRLGPEPVRVGLYFPLMRAWREWDA